MAQTPTVPVPVNHTAYDALSDAAGQTMVAQFYLVSDGHRDTEKAKGAIDTAIARLMDAAGAIETSEVREVRRPVAVGQQLLEREL